MNLVPKTKSSVSLRSLRAWSAAILILAFAVVANVRIGWKAVHAGKDSSEREAFAAMTLRLAMVAEHLPSYSNVGYMAETPQLSNKQDNNLYMAQYILAPRLVTTSKNAVDWLIVDSPGSPIRESIDSAREWQLVWRGEDVSLYHREK